MKKRRKNRKYQHLNSIESGKTKTTTCHRTLEK